MRAPLVPTARLLALLVLLAVLALLVAATAPGAWVAAPAAGVALLVLMLLDYRLAGALKSLDLTADADAEVGRPAAINVSAHSERGSAAPAPEAALGFDPRLGEGGTLQFPLSPSQAEGLFTAAANIVPTRRGTGSLTGMWLRWNGPLGLAARQAYRPLDLPIRVWPDLSPVRSPVLQNFLRDAQFGIVARRIRGEGTQFEALAEYQPGMDRRRIDWKASARHTALYARENEAERDNQIVFAMDCGQAMCEPIEGLPRLDRAISASLLASYVALKGGDKVALFGFAEKPLLMTPFAADARAFHRLQVAAAELDYSPREPNFTLALATLTAKLRRRSLIVLFSDFADPTSAELMVESVERLVRHHLVIFVTMEDRELQGLTERAPDNLTDIAVAVSADGLARQRALVLQRLRALGVNVIEAPHEAIGYRLIDLYLKTKQAEAVG